MTMGLIGTPNVKNVYSLSVQVTLSLPWYRNELLSQEYIFGMVY